MNIPVGTLTSEMTDNIGFKNLINDAVRGIQNVQLETDRLAPQGFHVSDEAAKADIDIDTLLLDNIASRAQKTLKNHMDDNGIQGDDKKQYPKLDSAGTLKEGMHGITRSEDGNKPLIITYSFGKNAKLKEYEAAPFGIKKVEASTYETFSDKERQLMRETFDEFEAEANVKYVEVENSEEAYLSIGKYDFSKQVNMHNGEDVGVGGRGRFPDKEGAYLLISTTHEVSKSILTHELLHNHGAYHTHQSSEIAYLNKQLDTQNASVMAYGRSAKGTPNEAWIGGDSYKLGMGEPETLQTLDIQYLQQYHGPAPAREPQLFVIDGKDKFYGTLPIREGDKFELNNAGKGVLDLRSGLENTSLLAQTETRASANPYTEDNPNKAMFWMTDTPTETQVEGGKPVIIMGDKPSTLTLENTDSTIVVGNGETTIDLGEGKETIIASESNIPVLLTDFDPTADAIRYGESVTHHELQAINGENIALNMFEDEKQVGQMIIEGASLAAMQNAAITTISDHEKAALMNGYRPALEIQPGDNGFIAGYNPNFHSLQYNQKFKQALVSEIEYENNQTHVTLRTHNERNREPIAQFSVAGELSPRELQLFNTGRKTECAKARFTSFGRTEVWAQDNGTLHHYRDTRETEHSGFGLKNGEVFVINGDHNHGFSQYDADVNKDAAHIYRSNGIDNSGELNISVSMRGETIAINRFNARKDTINVPEGSNIEAVKLEGGAVGLIVSPGESRNSPKRSESFIHIGELRGKSKNIKCITHRFDEKDGSMTKIKLPIEKIKRTDLSSKDKSILLGMQFDADSVKENIEQHFPDVNTAPTIEQEAPKLPPIPTQGGGRGR